MTSGDNTDFFAPLDQQEDLSDIGEADRRYEAVINQADWTVGTIIQQIDKGNIELNPEFQRREAWRQGNKSQYIESLIINVPVPQIVLAERRGKRGKFIVIDGKQRLLTLRQFFAKRTDKSYNSFRLQGLTVRQDLNGIDFEDFAANPSLESDLDILQNSTIRTAVIKGWTDETFLYSVFLRLNTGSVSLSPQELRQALHPGDFLRYIDKFSSESQQIRTALGLSAPDPRMRDAELVIRYLAFRNFLWSYTGNLKPLLDTTSRQLNDVWPTEQHEIRKQLSDLEDAIDFTISIFGKPSAFRKWNGLRYERALNRAIFDVMAHYFANSATRHTAETRKTSIVEAFQALCTQDDFRQSVEGTTKSIDAIYTRLRLWGETLNGLGITVQMPTLQNNKIILGS
jgi:hypothetical protein